MDSITLLGHMPNYYNKSDVIANILRAISNEFTRYETDCENTVNELTLYSASSTLNRYESDFVLPTSNNYANEYRISKILSKLRGQGTITEQVIKDVAQSFSNGEVEMSTIPSEYTLIITFTGVKGIPPNIDDLKDVLERLKTADWQIQYVYTWLTLDEHDNYNKTWDAWDTLNLTWDEYEVYKEVI